MTSTPAREARPDPRPVAVLDIDGVLADVGHRLGHLTGAAKDWTAFFAAMTDDPLLPEGAVVAAELAPRHRIIYVTGRPERYRDATERWLRRHGLPAGQVVHRRDGDRRPARVLKPDLVGQLGRTASIAVVVDDDAAVVAALRAVGVPVLHADWAPPHQILLDAQREGGT